MTSPYKYPAINLRMKWSSPETTKDMISDLLTDQINVMAELDQHYQCGDYLLQPTYDDNAVDSLSRKKMIDWKFRVVDHFGISRETVATSTNLLDRFVYQHTCDRMVFKLAAMTSLYMASKVDDYTQLPLAKLVELSRGEFLATDIVEMESTILKALSWRVNPVTVHSFIHSLVQLVPVADSNVVAAIHDRAIFFAELCLFDYSYVTRSRSDIAVAAVLNALEGMGDSLTATEDSEQAFLEILHVNTCIDVCCQGLEHLREDLWYVYSMSSQYQEDDMHMFSPKPTSDIEKQHPIVFGNDIAHSPVSVFSRNSS